METPSWISVNRWIIDFMAAHDGRIPRYLPPRLRTFCRREGWHRVAYRADRGTAARTEES